MNKINYRNSFLSLTCISICLAAVYSLIQPTVGNRQVEAFTFPDRVPLKSWQLVKTEPITNSPKEQKNEEEYEDKEVIASAKNYIYRKENVTIEAEMRYLVGTRGSVHNILAANADIPLEILAQSEIQKLNNIGFHTLFTHEDRVYLSSCINSRGQTTVSPRQFSKNRYKHDFKLSVLLPWLLSKETIRDSRCLLVNLSTPIANLSSEAAHTMLQDTWQDWYQLWQPRFPNL